MNALLPLLLAYAGLPVVAGGVALVARSLVHRHADAYSADVQRAHRAELVARRPKELTR